jgi:hypothetical protein
MKLLTGCLLSGVPRRGPGQKVLENKLLKCEDIIDSRCDP